MNTYIALFNDGTEMGDKLVYIEAENMDDAIDMAEALYIVMPAGRYDLMLVDTAAIVESLY